jgi:hypothetical protein
MWMMAAALAATAVSTAISASSAQAEGVAQQNALNAQGTAALRAAAEAETQAKDVAVQAQQEEAMRMAKLESMIGGNAAAAAASGITSDSGSVEAISAQNKQLVGQDISNVRYLGMARQKGLQRQAGYDRDAALSYSEAGAAARSAANMRMWGTIAKGASSALMYGSLGGMGGGGSGGTPNVAAGSGTTY